MTKIDIVEFFYKCLLQKYFTIIITYQTLIYTLDVNQEKKTFCYVYIYSSNATFIIVLSAVTKGNGIVHLHVQKIRIHYDLMTLSDSNIALQR